MRKTQGFTLLELLVVIAILGLITTIAIAQLNQAQIEARDTERLATLDTVRKALELYYDKYEMYPCAPANAGGGTLMQSVSYSGNVGTVPPDVEGEYLTVGSHPDAGKCNVGPTTTLFDEGFLSNPPINDPLNANICIYKYRYAYRVTLDRQRYKILVPLESEDDLMANDGGECTDVYEIGNDMTIAANGGVGVAGCP